MDFFISNAFANEAQTQAGSGLLSFLPLVLIFVVFYFLLIRPQQKRAKAQKNMVASLKVGDEVVSAGGILGKIKELDGSLITLEISTNVDIKIQKHQITQLLPKDTIK